MIRGTGVTANHQSCFACAFKLLSHFCALSSALHFGGGSSSAQTALRVYALFPEELFGVREIVVPSRETCGAGGRGAPLTSALRAAPGAAPERVARTKG